MSSKFLISASSQVEISDVVGLQDELDEIQEEIASGGGNKTIETFTQQITSTPSGFGEYKLYAKSDGFYERGTGAEVKLAGGGGGGIEYIGSSAVVNEGLVFASGLSRDLVQNKTGYSLDSFNNKLVVPDIETDEHSSINSTLTNISFNEVTQITSIQGELDVDKIKNIDHTAEVEFENTGKLLINCDDEINMKASLFEFKDSYDTQASTRGILINIDQNLSNYEISCPDWLMNLKDVYRIYGIESNLPDYIELDLAGIKLKTNNNNRISIESATNIDMLSTGNINLSAGGIVTTSNTPTTDNCVATKAYVDSKATFRKTIQTSIDNTSIYEDTYIKIGWDAPGNDVEVTILQQPTTAGVSIFSITKNYVASSSPSSEIYLTQINQKTDIYDVGLTPGNTLRFSIAAANDYSNTYPVYNVLVYNGGPATSFVVNKA